MKQHTITNGDKSMTFQICEGIEDINITRWNQIKKWIIQVESGTSIPNLRDMFTKFTAQFDKASPGGMYRVVHDYLHSLSSVTNAEDGDQMVFALMTLEDGEDPINIDESKLKDKLSRMADHGLTQGFVKQEVENFILGLTGQ
jgi:hypothetical protein